MYSISCAVIAEPPAQPPRPRDGLDLLYSLLALGRLFPFSTFTGGSIAVTGRLLFLHRPDQALGAHVGPGALDEGQAFVTAVLPEDHLPAVGNISEDWPQRVLALIID